MVLEAIYWISESQRKRHRRYDLKDVIFRLPSLHISRNALLHLEKITDRSAPGFFFVLDLKWRLIVWQRDTHIVAYSLRSRSGGGPAI